MSWATPLRGWGTYASRQLIPKNNSKYHFTEFMAHPVRIIASVEVQKARIVLEMSKVPDCKIK